MASLREIKRRKSSIQSTQQITKAMKLVATVKLQKARSLAEGFSVYFEAMYRTVASVLAKAETVEHPYLKNGASEKKAVAVLTSNHGLAGGYNANIIKLVTGKEGFRREDLEIYAIGRKGRESLERRGYRIKADASEFAETLTYENAAALCGQMLTDYKAGNIGEIYLAYTHFKNTIKQEARIIRLLPADICENSGRGAEFVGAMNFEPGEEEVLEKLIPKYVTAMIYGAMVDAAASENGARMQAMDAATANAEEIIHDLTLRYNRVRQSSITQELTEIIAGASAFQ